MQPQYITEAFTRFFWDKVNDSAGADACWPWLGKRYAAGYGLVRFNGIRTTSHRMAYILTHEPISDHVFIHPCHANKLCVNPLHLRADSWSFEQGIQRFWERVDRSGECWLWIGAHTPQGYGHVRIQGRIFITSRLSYMLMVGAIPDGQQVCHHCDNPSCVNPDHLFLGTNIDNIADKVNKGRVPALHGDCNPRAKITPAQVICIRDDYRAGGFSYRELAHKYGIGKSQVARIIQGESWGSS